MMHAPDAPRKLRTLIVDDEPLARTNLLILLRRHAEIEIVGECGSGIEALAEIRRSNPDLVFLDVQMPECDGFDVLEMLGAQRSCAIIFVTAYDTYALRAFEVGALDYLLKPFDDARFERTLERAKNRIAANDGAPPESKAFAIKSIGQILFVRMSEIDWIEAADYYASLHVGTRTHLLRRSMAELEQELDATDFCRIHRSTIVKIDRIRSLELNENGDYDVLLNDDTRLRMSRTYRKTLQSRLSLRSIE
jgi:two-component system, LytTR family, response regulator